jgi:hypothetical protein
MIVERVFLTALSAVGLLLAGCGSPTRPLEQTVEQTYPIEPTASISVENGDGTVRIYGADITEIRVVAIKRAYTIERLNKIAVRISTRPNSVSILTDFPPKPKWGISDRSGTVDYVIVVPETVNITRLKLDQGEILVEGLRGHETRARLGTGRLFVGNCFSNLSLELGTGPMFLLYDWWEPVKFSVQAKVEEGSVVAWIPGNASFHLLAEAPGISNNFTAAEQGRDHPRKIDSVIGPNPSARFAIDVASGSIRIMKAYP